MCINFSSSLIFQTKNALFISQDIFIIIANRRNPVINIVSISDSFQYSNGAFRGNISPNIKNNGQ